MILHLLIAFGALQSIFLFSILIFSNSRLSYRLFASFLLIEGITLIERLLAETNLMEEFPYLLGVSYPVSFLKPPILFLLALVLTKTGFRLKRKQLLHGVPFLMMLVLNIPFYGLSASNKVESVAAFINYVPSYSSFNFWFFLSFFLYIGVYLFSSIQVLIRYQNHIKADRVINWYLKVLYLYSFLLSLQLIHFVLRPSGLVDFQFVNEVSMLLMTFLIQSIAYQFLSHSKLLETSNGTLAHDLDQLSRNKEKIRNKLENEKVYLDDRLNLDAFASSVSLSKKQVSEIINQSFGTSFKGLINAYRVEEAKSLMSAVKSENVKLVELGLRSGFNNKVSFYRTFKGITGKSPSDYFQSIQKKS